ncbi:hypothetical protein HRbin36_00567 [bacterium HR36]|nr:hypothetical protein HRbin36_00567 [bacterium HR36]
MADGSVRFITRDISPEVFKALCTMAGGETLPPLDNVAPPVPPFTESAPVVKPTEKPKPVEKPASPVSRRDPWTPDANLLGQLAPEVAVGAFTFRPPHGYRSETAQAATSGEISVHWIGPVHQDVGSAPAIMISLTPLDTRLAGEPLDVVIKDRVARFPADGGKWEFDNHIERGLIQGRLFTRVACRYIGQDGQRLEGYYYQHTDGQLGLGILILDHATHAATTLPLLETSVATFAKR